MRNTILTLIGASLAALSPAGASAQGETPSEAVALNPDQQATFDDWPPDRKLAYGTWPEATQKYFWSLAPKRQELFWRLSDDDKINLSSMAPSEQDSVWQQLEARAKAVDSTDP